MRKDLDTGKVHWNVNKSDFSVSTKRMGNLDPTVTLNEVDYLTTPLPPEGQGSGPEFSRTYEHD